ncbi:MAG: FAD-binding protein [Anaerolineales bacterium]|nr:FAD-binding protein [Anaerolineales bacterium]
MKDRISTDVIERLRGIVGAGNVLLDDESMAPYSHDETIGLKARPDMVVKVESTGQISQIMKLAQQEKIPVIPRGAGYGLSGGAVATQGGMVLSVEKMTRILEIDRENLMITVEPGVLTGDIHRAVEAEGLFYPPDPASLDSCTIGGNVAEGAGGPRAVKYGITKDYVCGLEAVLPSGEIITCGGKRVKDVAGYNLIQLLIGSEGTLAIVTKIILKLIPLPRVQIDLLVPFDDFTDAADAVSDMVAQRVTPATIEFMERDSMQSVERLLQKELPFSDAAAHLLIQLDGNSNEALDVDFEIVGDICTAHNARDVLVARDQRTRDRLWEARRLIIDALNDEYPENYMEDVVVPRAQIPVLLRRLKEISNRTGVRIVCFGHAGDGNVHLNLLKESQSEEEWNALLPAVRKEIYQLCISLGGTITGEHGIGATRRAYLPLALDETQITLMRHIRDVFDPNHILNPGKIFP